MVPKNKAPVYVVVGTRAQLIKMAPVMSDMQRRGMSYKFIYTGQHKETIWEIISKFSIKSPDFDLSSKGKEASSIWRFAKWLVRSSVYVFFPRRIFPEKGLVLVHGDTISCAWGALVGRLGGCYVGHVESGLRSFSLLSPFPEELTRLLVFRLSNVYFAPDEVALRNLEGFRGEKINTMGNTLYDAVKLAVFNKSQFNERVPPGRYVVASVHRFENIFRGRFSHVIVPALEEIARFHKIIFVLHPSTRAVIESNSELRRRLNDNNNILMEERYSYFDFIELLYSSEFVITDGGSNQEELFYLGVPTLILRSTTERQEGLCENAVLSGFDMSVIKKFCESYNNYRCESKYLEKSPSNTIVDWVERFNI